MIKRLSLLVVPFLLAGCNYGYMPDDSLKKAWSQDLEDTQPAEIPYGLVYALGPKNLIYVAAAADRKEKSNALIEQLIQQWKPQVVLLQGHPEGQEVHPSKTQFHLKEYKPPLRGASANRQDILYHLAQYGITERDYVLYQVINLANQRWQFEAQNSESLRAKINSYLKSDPHAKKFHLRYADVKKWFHEKLNVPLTDELLVDGEIVAPKDPHLKSTTFLQALSTYEDEIDDSIVMESLSDELDENESVMIIRAPSKFVTERETLHQMLGVQQPTQIIN